MTSQGESCISMCAHVRVYMLISSVQMSEEEYSSTTDEAGSKDSSRTSSVLSLCYSSSPFDSHNSTFDTDEDSHRVEPYLYEPEQSSSDEAGDNDARTERLDNTEW